MKTPFLNPRLDGLRFEAHSVPLEVMKDWAAFEELVVVVARSLYLQENHDRQRVPNGFYENFSLHLSGVLEGSAKPVIEQVRTDQNAALRGLYERARDLILTTVAAVAIGGPIPLSFPREGLRYFDQFGKSLRPDERIELVVPDRPEVVNYNFETRKRLVLTTAEEYQLQATLRGKIVAFDLPKETYALVRMNGQRVNGTLTPEFTKAIHQALDPEEKKLVSIRGLVVFDRFDTPKRIEKIAHVEKLDPTDVPSRIEQLTTLKPGWLNGYGEALNSTGAMWLADTWDTSYPEELPQPYAYPTEEGNLQLEWTIREWELSANVNLGTKRVEMLSVKVGTEEAREAQADLNHAAGWRELANFVRQHQA